MSAFPDLRDSQTGPECVWPLQAGLGEGPLWSAADRSVYFVDIPGRAIHRYTPATGARTSWPAPSRPTFILPVEGGGHLCGLEDGLRRFDPENGRFGALAVIEPSLADNRINDGHVDAAGRLWFGTMHDPEERPTGTLYRLTGFGPHLTPEPIDDGYTVSNGPAIDPDRRRLYHSDSALRRIYMFELDADGQPGPRQLFAQLDDAYPDGMAVDQAGILWVALFAGGGIRRYRPDGRPDGMVGFPCDNVTKIAFGDDDGRTAYVTTARKGLSDNALSRQPLAGGLFRFRVEVPGVPQNLFRATTRQDDL